MTENRTLAEFGGDDADGDAETQDEPTDASVESTDATDPPAATGTHRAETTDSEPISETTNSEPTTETADSEPASEAATLTDSATPTDSEATIEPATVTYAWSSEGDACDACGETVDRRWRAGEGADDPDSLVCDDCKEW